MSLKYIFVHIAVMAACLLSPLTPEAQTLSEAKGMYLAGDFEGALPTFLREIKKKPKDAALNQWVGVCLMQAGELDRAIPYLKLAKQRNVAEAPRYLAEIAFQKYDFDEAEANIDAYEAALKKARKSMPEEVADLRRRVMLAGNMLERVEKIVVIDSVAVDREDFFKTYRLAPASGTINSVDILPSDFDYAEPTTVFMPESQTMMFWATVNDDNEYQLIESNKLFDGSWDSPQPVGDEINIPGDNNFPFLMSDGVTLYYANNGEGSIGGYDIFISRKEDDGYLQPQNIGMPYNSPYDDYLLAIDEITGVGWWATDRNQLEDSITIYKFIPSDLRQNYDPDANDIADKARISDFRSTWEEGKDYADVLKKIDRLKIDKTAKKAEFMFAMPGGRVYTGMNDFRNPRARRLMEDYLDARRRFAESEATLAKLRLKYRNGDRSSAGTIRDLERTLNHDRQQLKNMANEIIRQEN